MCSIMKCGFYIMHSIQKQFKLQNIHGIHASLRHLLWILISIILQPLSLYSWFIIVLLILSLLLFQKFVTLHSALSCFWTWLTVQLSTLHPNSYLSLQGLLCDAQILTQKSRPRHRKSWPNIYRFILDIVVDSSAKYTKE